MTAGAYAPITSQGIFGIGDGLAGMPVGDPSDTGQGNGATVIPFGTAAIPGSGAITSYIPKDFWRSSGWGTILLGLFAFYGSSRWFRNATPDRFDGVLDAMQMLAVLLFALNIWGRAVNSQLSIDLADRLGIFGAPLDAVRGATNQVYDLSGQD